MRWTLLAKLSILLMLYGRVEATPLKGVICDLPLSPANITDEIADALSPAPKDGTRVVSFDERPWGEETREERVIIPESYRLGSIRESQLLLVGIKSVYRGERFSNTSFDFTDFKLSPRQVARLIADDDSNLDEAEKKIRKALFESFPRVFLESLADPERKTALNASDFILLPPQVAANELTQHIPVLSKEEFSQKTENFLERFLKAIDHFRESSREASSTLNLKAEALIDSPESKLNGKSAEQIKKSDAEKALAELIQEAQTKYGFTDKFISRLKEMRNQAYTYDVNNIDQAIGSIRSQQIGVALAPLALLPVFAAPALAGRAAFVAVQGARPFSFLTTATPSLSQVGVAGVGLTNHVAGLVLTPPALSAALGGIGATIDAARSTKPVEPVDFLIKLTDSAAGAGVEAIPMATAFGALPFATLGVAGFVSGTSNLLSPVITGGLTLPRALTFVEGGTAAILTVQGGIQGVEGIRDINKSYQEYLRLKLQGPTKDATEDQISEAGGDFYKKAAAGITDVGLNLLPALSILNRNIPLKTKSGVPLNGLNPDVARRLNRNYEDLELQIQESTKLKKAGKLPSNFEQAQSFAHILRLRAENYIYQKKIPGLAEVLSNLRPGDPMPRNVLDVMAANLGTSVETLLEGFRFGYDTDSFYARLINEGYRPNKAKLDKGGVIGSQAHLNNDGSANLVSIADEVSDGAILLMIGIADPRKPPKLSGTVAVLKNVENSVKVPEAACFHQGIYCQNEHLTPQVQVNNIAGLSHWTAKPVVRITQDAAGRPVPVLEAYQIIFKKPVDLRQLMRENPNLSPSELKALVESQPNIDTPGSDLAPRRVEIPKTKAVDANKVYPTSRLSGANETTIPVSQADSVKLVRDILDQTSQPLAPIDLRPQLQVSVADSIHLAWQESARASGRTERFKPAVDSQANGQPFQPEILSKYLKDQGVPENLHRFYKVQDGKLQEDILGLPNRYLHTVNRAENDSSAGHAMNLILARLESGDRLDKKFIDAASEKIHDFWLDRNRDNSWVTDDQRLPFNKLSKAEADKDRDVIIRAIKTFNEQVVFEPNSRSPKNPTHSIKTLFQNL